MAIPSLFNVFVISLMFFMIYGIIGVNYFKGSFYKCVFGFQFSPEMQNFPQNFVETKYDCINQGGEWVNADQNFDNIFQALSTLFQVSSTEGWIDIMNKGVDSVGIDLQPKKNQNQYWSIYFMFFIILGCFLVLDLFVGVVVSTFNRE
jgi:voltage-gated cation channel